MKIHIYKWPTDKIPLNAVPFYREDTAKDIEDVEALYKKWTLKASERFNMETFDEATMDSPDDEDKREAMLSIYNDDIANEIRDYIKNRKVFIVNSDREWDWRLCLLCHEDDEDKRLIVDSILWMWMWTYVDSYRGFLKLLNEKFKEMWYKEVWYHFPVGRRLKPDLSKEDYDRVIRLWATDNYMGTRCYIKYLDKRK